MNTWMERCANFILEMMEKYEFEVEEEIKQESKERNGTACEYTDKRID